MSDTVIQYIVSPILAAFVGYLFARLNKKEDSQKARDRADVVLLRKMLKEYYDEYRDKPEMDEVDYQNFIDGYAAYHELGGNGMVTQMYNVIIKKQISQR